MAATAATVITGSYNFTQAAQSKNAENVVVISRQPRLTDRFVANFEYHRAGNSIPWRAQKALQGPSRLRRESRSPIRAATCA